MFPNTHHLPENIPEALAPSFQMVAAGPINGRRPHDFRIDFERLTADMRTAWDFAALNLLAVLSISGDRNGAYMIVAPSPRLHDLLGDEASRWHQAPVKNGLVVEYWVGHLDHIRIFWREVKCTH